MVYDLYHHPLSSILPFFGVVPGQFTPIPKYYFGACGCLVHDHVYVYFVRLHCEGYDTLSQEAGVLYIHTVFKPVPIAVQCDMALAIAIRLQEMYKYGLLT